jgi:hypothetical protein
MSASGTTKASTLHEGSPLRMLKRANGTPAAYGSVRFPGSRRTPAKWACVTVKQNPEGMQEIVRLLSDTWRLTKPSVLISVCGQTAGDIPMNDKQQRVVRRGLLRVVRTTRALLITDGLSGGVASLVGKAVHESGNVQLPCLGIACWDEVRHRAQLEAKGTGLVCKYGEIRAGATDSSARALGERSRGRSPPKGHAKASLESSVLAQAPKRVPALDKASRCDDPWGLAPSTD